MKNIIQLHKQLVAIDSRIRTLEMAMIAQEEDLEMAIIIPEEHDVGLKYLEKVKLQDRLAVYRSLKDNIVLKLSKALRVYAEEIQS